MKRIGNRVLAIGMILASVINISPMSHIYASSEKSLQNTNKIEAEMVCSNVENLEKEITDLQEKIKNLNKDKEINKDQIKKLQEKLDSYKNKEDNFLEYKKCLEDQLLEKERVIKGLEEKICALESKDKKQIAELEQLRDEVKKLQEESEKLKEELSSAKWELEAKGEKAEVNEESFKEIREKIGQLEKEIKEKDQNIELKEEKIKEIEDTLKAKEERLEELQDQVDKAKEDKENSCEKVKSLEEELTELRSKSEKDKKELQEHIKSLEDKIEQQTKEFESLQNDLDKKIEECNKKISELEKNLKENKTGKKEKALNDKEKLEKILENLKKKQAEIETKHDKDREEKITNKEVVNTKEVINKREDNIKPHSKSDEFSVFQVGKDYYNVIKDGKKTTVYMDVKAYIQDDHIMLPIRYTAYTLGFNVEYDDNKREAIFSNKENIVLPKKTLRLNIDTGVMKDSDGNIYHSDTKPVIINGRVHASISNIAKAFNATCGDIKDGKDQSIEWDNNKKAVYVFKNIK